MAQPTSFILNYLGAVTIQAKKTYSSDDILNQFDTANIMVLKTQNGNTPIKVSINGTDAFCITFDEIAFLEAGKSYIFDTDCTLAIAKYEVVS